MHLLSITLVFTLIQFRQNVEGKGDFLEFTAGAGATVDFECKNTHESFDKVTWWRNDSSEFVAEKGEGFLHFNGNYSNRLSFQGKNLVISDCQGLDLGFYFCETTSKGEKRRGGYYRFIVEEKPKCDKTVAEINVLNGTSAFLPCYVRGEPRPSFQWRKVIGRNVVELNGDFTPTTRGLKIRHMIQSYAGTYKVTLRSRLGIFTREIQVNVKTRDAIKAHNYQNISLGADITLDCEKYTVEKGTTIEWKDSSGSDASLSDRFTVLRNGSLAIKRIQLTDDGLYTCKKRTKKDGGIWLKSVLIYLNVQFAPQIITLKSNVKVYKNSHVRIVCIAKGNPTPHSRWYSANGTVLSSSKKYEIFRNGSLMVRNVQLSDVMNYTCAPYNSVGTANRSTRLSVIVPPYIAGKVKLIIRKRLGDSVTMNCSAGGFPKPGLTWTFGDTSVAINQRNRIIDSRVLIIKAIERSDEGIYKCIATSSAGTSTRQFRLIVLNKPQTPKQFFVITQNGSMHFSWKPAYNGGEKQTFEVWFRATYKTDYQWSSVGVISNKYKIHLDDTDTAGVPDVLFYCSLRAQNSEGYSDFTPVVKTAKLLPRGDKLRSTRLESGISEYPLSPYAFTVDISMDSYVLKWNYLLTPGRPKSSKFLIEYRERNSTRWKMLEQNGRTRRSLNAAKGQKNVVNINNDDIPGLTHPLQFRVYAVTSTNRKSKPAVPIVNDARAIIVGASIAGSKIDLIPPIVMAIIFGLFTVILVVGLYCYCDRKKKRVNTMEESKINLVANDNNSMNRDSLIIPDNIKVSLSQDYTRYHLQSCPALKLGESNKTSDLNKPDDVFVLLKPNAQESIVCTCSKNHVALNSLKQLKSSKKRSSLYRSTSLPSLLLSTEADIPLDVTPAVKPEALGESNSNDGQKDCSNDSTENETVTLLKRGGMFRDSYDKFCRTDSTLRKPKAKAEANKANLNELPEANDSSPETEKAKIESVLSVCKASDDENTETKSIKSNKSTDGKSSGFGDGESSASDPDSIALDTPTPTHKVNNEKCPLNPSSKKDTGYFSDVPSAVSPLLPPNKNVYNAQKHKSSNSCKNSGYFSENETSRRPTYNNRPLAPPSYNQAIIDIERMSESSATDVTDSENMCKQLLEMERQMGVKLDDSIDDHLDKRHILEPPPRFQNFSYRENGYMSDIGTSTVPTKYSNREKNRRCQQLLNEFKNNKQLNLHEDNVNKTNVTSAGFTPKHTLRSKSVMESVISEELPSLKRSGSTSTDICNEWLV